jgi:ABC-type transporter Mla MlaB component
LSVSVEQEETRCVVRLDGETGLSEAAELKRLLLEGLASGQTLHLDLERLNEIDVAVMQLLQATLRETGHRGTSLAVQLSEAADIALRGAGFGPCMDAAGWCA